MDIPRPSRPNLDVRRRGRRAVGTLVGSPDQYPTRILAGLIIASGLVMLAGAYAFIGAQVDAANDSTPALRVVSWTLKNWFVWALLAVLAAGQFVRSYGRRAAEITARETNFDARSIQRLSAEMKTIDGGVRLIGLRSHSEDQLRAKLMRAWSGQIESEHPDDVDVDEPVPEDTGVAIESASGGVDIVPYTAETEGSELDRASGLRESLQVWRMDLATSLNLDDILWRFLAPAIATAAVIVVLAGRAWFSWWVYPVIAASSLFVGSLYFLQFRVRRRRSLQSLRETRDEETWHRCVTFAKTVDVPETTLYVAFMAGKSYADYDRDRLARTVANRWHQRLQGERVAPAVQEKFARNIKQMMPSLHEFEVNDAHEGRPAIMDDIVDAVRQASDPEGIVPKNKLGELVSERGEGVGHDPDLIAELYRDLVPVALAETDIEVSDSTGNTRTVTLVHLRSHALPDDLAQIRARFSEFDLGAEPVYALPQRRPDGLVVAE